MRICGFSLRDISTPTIAICKEQLPAVYGIYVRHFLEVLEMAPYIQRNRLKSRERDAQFETEPAVFEIIFRRHSGRKAKSETLYFCLRR